MPDYTFAITGQDLSGPAWKSFVENVKKANQQVSDLKKPADEVRDRFKAVDVAIEKVRKTLGGLGPAGDALNGLIDKVTKVGNAVGTVAKIGGAVGTVVFAAKEIYDYGESVQQAASEMVKLATAHNLTTDQVQALQDLAKRTGKTFDEVAASVGKNKLALDTLTQTYVATGQAIDTNVTAKVAEMERQSKESTERMEVHFNKVRAFVAELYIPAKSSVLDLAANSLDNVSRAVNALDLTKLRGIMGLLMNPAGAIATVGQAVINGSPLERAESEVRNLKGEYDQLIALAAKQRVGPGPGSVMPHVDDSGATIDQAVKVAQRLQAAQQRLDQERRKTWGAQGFGGPDPFGMVDPVTGAPKTTTTGGGGGGGGRTDDDMLAAQIARYEALGSAATRAIGAINTQRGKSLEDMTREVSVQRQIDEIVGKLGAKYTEASQAQKDRLRAAVSGSELERAAVEKLMQAHTRADQVERQYGDGKLVFVTQQNQLKEAFETGRLSVEAYDNAMKINAQTTEDLRLKNIGLQGGMPALAAGFENARLQADRANNMFATGGKVYEQLMGTMTMATQSWGESFDSILLKAGASWTQFLANMAMQAAASQLWGIAGPAISGIISGITGAFGGYVGTAGATELYGSASSTMGSLAFGGPRAAGGPVSAGRGYIVGENGPEWFQPDTGGNILNRQQLDALGISGGPGSYVVNVYQTIHVGEFVTTTQYRQGLIAVERSAREGAQQGIIAAGRRGSPRLAEALR